MSGNRAWTWVREKFYKRAGHAQHVVIPENGAVRLVADNSYVRIWLSEFFLATERSWTADRTPAVKASVRVLFRRAADVQAPETQTFAILIQPPVTSGRGVFRNYQITAWLPYQGQSIELEAALYAILGKSRLLTAIDIVSDFALLVAPPVSAALEIADRVANAIEKIIKANGTAPKLPVHQSLTEAGWLAVVDAAEDELPRAELHVNDAGELCRNGKRITGHDYLVLRVETCKERDDWLTPDLDTVIAAALNARDIDGNKQEYQRLRNEALRKVGSSPDFTSKHRMKAAVAVKKKLNDTSHGAVADGGVTLAEIVAHYGLPSDHEVEFLTLEELIDS